MIDTDKKFQLEKLIAENPNQYSNVLRSPKYADLVSWINQQISPCLDNPTYSIKTKIYWILNDIHSFEDKKCRCRICGKSLEGKNVRTLDIGYFPCSNKCSTQSKETVAKRQKTMLEKYGATDFLNSTAGKESYKKWLEENNVSNTFQIQSVKDKIKETVRNKYGVDNVMQNKEICDLAHARFHKEHENH